MKLKRLAGTAYNQLKGLIKRNDWIRSNVPDSGNRLTIGFAKPIHSFRTNQRCCALSIIFSHLFSLSLWIPFHSKTGQSKEITRHPSPYLMIITILNGIAYDHPSSFKGIILTYSHPLLHLSRFLRGTRSDPLNLKSNPLDLGHLRSTVLKSRPLFLLQVARGRWPLRAIRGSSLRARLRERRGLQRAVPDLPPLHLRARVLRLRSPQSSLRNWTLFVCVRERWPRFPRLSTSPIFQTVA